jgi:uncharacterized protein (DUF1697 family)
MARFVVLLRGVNVGKGNRLAMADFRARLEALGFTGVRTLLNSGNAVVSSPARSTAGHAKAIHMALQADSGLDIQVVVLSSSEFNAVITQNPLARIAEDHSRLLVAFAQDPAAIQALAALAPMVQSPERLCIGSRAAYLFCPGGLLESKAASALLGKAGRAVTTRNWATVLKLGGLLKAVEG